MYFRPLSTFALTLLAGWFAAAPLRAQSTPVASAPAPATVSTQPAAAAAPANVVVFSDFACPYSADLYFTLRKYQERHPGQVHLVYKQSPLLSIHPEAGLAHRAALAAALQGKYDAMAELLYSNQAHQDLPTILAYARHLRLDTVRFRRDLDSAAVKAQLDADLAESAEFEIEQTPTMYLHGKPLAGVQSEQSLAVYLGQPADLSQPGSSAPNLAPRLDKALAAQLASAPAAEQGPANAPLTIVEFTDFQCPFCRAAVEPMEQLMKQRGREVRWVFRAFPLDFHPDSELATEAALAAGEQGRFWEMHDLLFARQAALKPTDLRSYAESLHLDMKRFDEALATHRFAAQVAADRALGTRAEVSATPTFFIDGQALEGVRSLPELNQLADAFLRERNGAGPSPLVAAKQVAPPEIGDQQVLGPHAATPLTVTWYADVRSSLAERQAALIQALNKRYEGKVRVLFRAVPLDAHADGRLGAAALLAALMMPGTAEAKAEQNFWALYTALAVRRDVLDRDKVLEIAAAAGLDRKSFGDALDAAAKDVELNREEAARRGIQGAPVVFVGDQRIDGLQAESRYTKVLDEQLELAAPAVRASAKP